jgi:hypothetical protein
VIRIGQGLAALSIALSISSSVAAAEFISLEPSAVDIAVYRDRRVDTSDLLAGGSESSGLIMVTETRTLTIPAGRSEVIFRGVADLIVPQTAKLTGAPVDIVASNFDYDLMTPGAIVAKSVGKRVRLVRTNSLTGATTEIDGVLRSGPHGVTIETASGVEALHCSGDSEKLVFDRVPEGLADKPTLSMTLDAARTGSYQVRLSYLALGAEWSADYIATIHPDGKQLDLQGWITLVNHSRTAFVDAPIHVIAGELSRNKEETVPPEIEPEQLSFPCWEKRYPVYDMMPASSAMNELEDIVVTGMRRARMSELGDYKMYSLPGRTTLAANQSKQVQFLDRRAVPLERLYRIRVERGELDEPGEAAERLEAQVVLRVQNRTQSNLGLPLPAGNLVAMAKDATGRTLFSGEMPIGDTPKGLPVEFDVQQAIEVWAEAKVESVRSSQLADGRTRHRAAVAVTLVNDKSVAVDTELLQDLGLDEEHTSVRSEFPPHGTSGNAATWQVQLGPHERRTVKYTLELIVD